MAKACVLVGWDDVPHLTAEQKSSILEGIPPWQREARTRGLPSMGAGAIYPLPEADIIVQPFVIPEHWPRAFALDPGWNMTAALFLAFDTDAGGIVAYDEYYVGQREPAVHAAALKRKGADWMTGVIDPAAQGIRGHKGEVLLDVYRDEFGMKLELAENAVMPGLIKTWHALSIGQLKLFSTLTHTRNELRLYRRDEKGNIIKEHDHLMDCMRYGVMSARAVAKIKPIDSPEGRSWFSWTPPTVWSG